MTTHATNSQYSAFLTLWKALLAFLSAVTGGEVALYTVPLPEDVESFRLRWPVYAVAALLAFWRAWENIRKQFALVTYPWERPAGGRP